MIFRSECHVVFAFRSCFRSRQSSHPTFTNVVGFQVILLLVGFCWCIVCLLFCYLATAVILTHLTAVSQVHEGCYGNLSMLLECRLQTRYLPIALLSTAKGKMWRLRTYMVPQATYLPCASQTGAGVQSRPQPLPAHMVSPSPFCPSPFLTGSGSFIDGKILELKVSFRAF